MTWLVTGNAGTTTSNFLGTTDARPLVVKTAGSERLRVSSTGDVSVGSLGGTRSPSYRFDVVGVLNADDIYKNGAPLVGSQWSDVTGGITYSAGEVGVGSLRGGYKLNVDGVLNASDIHKNGVPLEVSQWEDVAGGVNYGGGSVGIGATEPKASVHISSAEPQLRIDSTGDRAVVQLGKSGALQWDFGVGTSAGNNDLWFGDFSAYRLVVRKGGGVYVAGPSATTNIETTELLRLVRPGVGGVKNSNSAGLFVGAFEAGISGRSKLDIRLAGGPGAGNNWGEIPDVSVLSLSATGDVAILNKHAFRGSDPWLRLNQDGAFTAGVHTPGVFAPGSLNVGGAGGWGNPGGGNAWIVGSLGIGTTALAARLNVAGGSWNPTDSEGDLKIGDATYRLKIGVATGGGGAGDVRIRAHGGTNRLMLGSGTTDTLFIVNDTVGVGTMGPAVKLHAVGNRIRLDNGAGHTLDLRADGSALDLESNGADLYINNNNIAVRIRNLIQGSSRDLKENIADFGAREAVEALLDLKPVTFNWRDDGGRATQLGFVAEDSPSIATIPDKTGIVPMHILTILSKVVQEQQRTIDSMRREPGPKDYS